jgi:type II secretory pathway component PulF
MNHEQLSFFNQQLAAMLKSGLPLESSLKQLSASMSRGPLREEIQKLEVDLEQGVPLEEALGKRRLPELYVAMLRAGLKGNDLPGVLTLAADYYGHLHRTWSRLKGLLVYPGIVLVTSFLVAAFLAIVFTRMVAETGAAFSNFSLTRGPSLPVLLFQVWLPVVLLGLTTVVFALVLSIRQMRSRARWKLPGFREASLSQLASTLALMLEQGVSFDAALAVAEQNENAPNVRRELALWRQRLASGGRRFADIAQPGLLAPPLFTWLVTGAGENLACGFRRAAETYDARARYRIELALYAALPVAVLLVAAIVGLEMTPLVRGFMQFMNAMTTPDL